MTLSKLKILIAKIKLLARLKITSFYDFILFKLGIFVRATEAKEQSVLYLGANLPPRIARMVKWLKRSGDYNTILVCHKEGFNAKFSNEYFDSIILFRNKWHLYRILSTIKKPRLIHSFGPKSYYPDLAREFMKGVKFIYDMQDVLVSYFGLEPGIKWYYDEFPHEKNCLEKADGIVSHGLEPIPGFKLYNIKKNNNVLFFPLYCDDDFFKDNTKNADGDIHLVYAGEIHGAHRDKKQFGNVQLHELIDELSRQKLHLHVYPSPATLPAYYSGYSELSERNQYFHLHAPVSQGQLIEELSKYHFGIIPFFKESSRQSENKYRYSTALKLFNFIEAGIPIVISKDITFQCWIANRYHAAVPVSRRDMPDLKGIISKVDYREQVRLLQQAREKLSLKKNIYRLESFYNKVAPRS